MNLAHYLHGVRRMVRHPVSFIRTRIERRRIMSRAARKPGPSILIQRHAGIGDIVCSLPAVQALRAKYPDSYLVYETWSPSAPIVECSNCTDEVVASGPIGQFGSVNGKDFDLAFYPVLPDEEKSNRPHMHLVDDFCRMLGVQPADRQPRLALPDLWRARAERILEAAGVLDNHPLIAIHTGPSWRVREWTHEGWAELVARLSKRYGATIIQLGSDSYGADRVPAQRVAGAIDLLGERHILETTGIILLCDYFIGLDSGLFHLAGAVGTPVLGLFGAINPAYRLPPTTPGVSVTSDVPCLGCHHTFPMGHWKTGCPYDARCMSTLSPDRVLAAFEMLTALAVGRDKTASLTEGTSNALCT